MKSKMVKPVLIDIKEYVDKYPFLGLTKNKLSLYTETNVSTFETVPKELILISLGSKEYINKGDVYYNTRLNKVFLAIANDGYPSEEDFKVIAKQSQIPLTYIQQFVEEYNKGKVKDIEIELTTHTYDDWMDNGDSPVFPKPKLTDGFITIIKKRHYYQ